MNKFEKLLQDTEYKVFKGFTDDDAGTTLSIIVPISCTVYNYINGNITVFNVGTRNIRLFSPDIISIFKDKPAPKMCTLELTVKDFNNRVNITKREYYDSIKYYIFLDNQLILGLTQYSGSSYVSTIEYFGELTDDSKCYRNISNTFIEVFGITSLYKSKFNHISPLFTLNSTKPENDTDFDCILDAYYKIIFVIDTVSDGNIRRLDTVEFVLPSFLVETSSGVSQELIMNLYRQIESKYRS